MRQVITTILIFISTIAYSQDYTYTDKLNLKDFLHTSTRSNTLISYGLAATSGIMQGHREIYHAYPQLLQDYYRTSDESWIGKYQWKRNYVDNNPENEHKPEIFNTFRDMHHFTGTTQPITITVSTVLIWNSKYPRKYKWFHTVGLILTRSLAANLTYSFYARHK